MDTRSGLPWRFLAMGLFVLLVVACASGGGDDDSGDDDTGDDDTGADVPEAEGDVGPAGGVIEVEDPDSPLYRLKLEIPAGALTAETTIGIYVEDDPPSSPAGVTVAGAFARLEPAGLRFETPIWLHVPWMPASADDGLAVGHYDAQASEWAVLPAWGVDDEDRPLALTDSFSIFGGFFFPLFLDADTDFAPAADGFSIINRGVIGEPDGSCWGFALYSRWYYKNRDAMADDLWRAYAIPTAARVARDAIALQDGYDRIFARLAEVFRNTVPYGRSTLETVVGAMLITHQPQPVILKAGWFSGGGHVVVAIGWNGEDLTIYDPNLPGETPTIHWNGITLDPYGDYDMFFTATLETFFTEDGMQGVHDNYDHDGPAKCGDCGQSMEYFYDLLGYSLNPWSKDQAISACQSGDDPAVWSCVKNCVCKHAMTRPDLDDLLGCLQPCPEFGGDDDDTGDDDTGDDDTGDDDTCDPAVSTPTLDFSQICHTDWTNIDECLGENVHTATFTLAEAEDWGVFTQYTDNGCDLGWFVLLDGTEWEVPEDTACGTPSEPGHGIMFFYMWDDVCAEHPGQEVDWHDQILLKDTCGYMSDAWEYTITVICP